MFHFRQGNVMRHAIAVLVFIGCVAAISPVSAQPGELEKLLRKLSPEQIGEVQDTLEELMLGRVHLTVDASVVDQEGKPVTAFTIAHPRSLTDTDYKQLQKERGEAMALQEKSPDLARRKWLEATNKFRRADMAAGKDGQFHLDLTNLAASDLQLKLTAAGYYPAELQMTATNEKQKTALGMLIIESLSSKKPLPKEYRLKKTLRVVMRKKGQPAALEPFSVVLEVTRKGDRLGYQFAISPKDKGKPVTVGQKVKMLPARSFWLSVKQDEGGKIQTEKIGASNEVPTDVKLIIKANPGDGFIRYQPQDFRSRETGDSQVRYASPEPIRRQMATAPETGYLAELPLSFSDGPIYLYFKCAGRYGCARYISSDLEKDGSKFSIRFELEVQPDGSRNLETGE
jgi:hypothetical protein